MKSQYVEELRAGETVKEKFVLTRKILKEKKGGGNYAVLEFTDRTGSIEGIAWDNVVESLNAVSVGDFVFISGTVGEYNDRLQVVLNSIRRIPDEEADALDFMPRCPDDVEKIIAEIQAYKTRVNNVYLKKLLSLFFDDPVFLKNFKLAPAAKRAHHAYLGGLAVHTLNILKLLMHIQSVYDFLDIDLLITAGILHDVGKISEYAYAKKIDISTEGKLLGHIMLGYEMIVEKIRLIDGFPKDLRWKLLHMIISHHGEFEWGSPREPMFLEALVLHFIDNLDSKVAMIREELKKNRGKEREWSDYHQYLERELYLR